MKGSIRVNKSIVALIAVSIGVLCLSSRAMADAAGDYQTLFGQEETAAAAKGAAASAEFAGKLLNAAKSAGGQRDLQVLLCDKAYEFGMKAPAGYQTAADAMKLLTETMPDKKIEAREKLLKVQQLRYARARNKDEREAIGLEVVELLTACGNDKAEAKQRDEAVALYRQALTLATACKSDRTVEITDKIKEISAAQEAERRIASLKARVERNPKDASARTDLIMAYLGQLDSPAEAVKLLTPDVDEGLRTYVPLAAKKVTDLKEAMCIELAEWLLAVADKASPADKGVLLGRAKACCEQYLRLHTDQDAALLKGKMLLEKVEKAIEAAGPRFPKNLVLDLGRGVTMKLVLVPAGTFLMGSAAGEEGRGYYDSPQHEVTISKPFYMGVCEVTQEQYEAVTGIDLCGYSERVAFIPAGPVSWDDAIAFCKKMSSKVGRTVRLPTEAQWEYACRAGSKTRFCFGDDEKKLGDYAWYSHNTSGYSRPVGLKKPNAFGLYDMHGNLWEWCNDKAGESYGSSSSRRPVPKSVDPTGPATGSLRILRGGCHYSSQQECRSAHRLKYSPEYRYGSSGIRVAVDPK